MEQTSSVVCICETNEEAQRAMYNLEEAGIDMGTLSIAHKDTSLVLHGVDYYNRGDECFSIPGIGPLLVSGPLGSWIATAAKSGTDGKGNSFIGTALAALGVPHDSVLRYEDVLRTERYLLVVHGSSGAVASALAAIGGTVSCFRPIHHGSLSSSTHAPSPPAKATHADQA